MSAKLGEILVRENLISPQHLREALDYQREHGGRLGYNLVKLGLVSDDMITAVLAEDFLKAPENKGATVVYDLRSSHVVPDTIRQLGGVPRRGSGHRRVTLARPEPNGDRDQGSAQHQQVERQPPAWRPGGIRAGTLRISMLTCLNMLLCLRGRFMPCPRTRVIWRSLPPATLWLCTGSAVRRRFSILCSLASAQTGTLLHSCPETRFLT